MRMLATYGFGKECCEIKELEDKAPDNVPSLLD